MKGSTKRFVSMMLAVLMTLGMVAAAMTVNLSALSYGGSSSYRSGKYYSQLTSVQLTGNQRTDIINVASSQIGYQEGNNSSQLNGSAYGSGDYTEYGRWYGVQSLWCAMFVSWCASTAGISTGIVPKHSYTVSGLQWFMNQGRAYSRAQVAAGQYTPQPGDIIYFKYARNNAMTNHVGIVTGYSNGMIHTIEGNTSAAGYSSNGGVVAPKTYSISNSYIVYICKPNYKGATIQASSYSSGSVSIPAHYKDWVFDANYYANRYADLRAAYGYDAGRLYNHFVTCGIREGRVGSALFDVKYYVSSSADLRRAFGTNYVAAFNHFINNGCRETTRKYSATLTSLKDLIFDAQMYYNRYADLRKVYGMDAGKLFNHFMTCGIKEGRVASPFFDVSYYRTKNADLKAAFGSNNWSAFSHFVNAGGSSQHKASPVVDTRYYTNKYADLRGMSTHAAIRHFKDHGAGEGRVASASFNVNKYWSKNADVRAAYTKATCCYHYMAYGIVERRSGT